MESISRFARNPRGLLELLKRLTATQAMKRLNMSKAKVSKRFLELKTPGTFFSY